MIRWLPFLLAAVSANAATTITLRPSASTPDSGDTYLRAAAATSNFGAAGALVISGSGPGNTKGEFGSVLKFDLSTVTAAFDASYGVGNWTLESIRLEFTAAEPNNVNFNANAAGAVNVDWLADDSWIESGASGLTWSGLSSLISSGSESMGSLFFNGSLGTSPYTLNSTAGFANDLIGGSTVTLLLSATGDPGVSVTLNSRNFGTPASRPALIISASPEPNRSIICVLGIAALTFSRQRNQRNANREGQESV